MAHVSTPTNVSPFSRDDIDPFLLQQGRAVSIFKILADAFGAAQDIGIGALFAVLSARYFGIEPSIALLVLGSWLAVLPDMDIVLPAMLGRTIAYNHHETMMHRPLIIIPLAALLGCAIGYYFGHAYFGLYLGGLTVLYHYLHDTPGGIAWGYPFSRTYWSPFGKVVIEAMFDPVGSHLHFMQMLLTPTFFSIRELTIAGVTMALAINIVTDSHLGTVLALLGALFVLCTWGVYHRISKAYAASR